MPKPNDLSRSFTAFEQDSTLVAIIEMSLTSWLVGGIVPGIERHPLKKLDVDEEALLQLLHRWRDEAINAGRKITRIVLAFEAGRDGFWLARWLRARNIEAYVIHPNSVAVSREHRRAKTDRLDTELLKRVFLGWLRGESDHCSMAAIPTLGEEDARRPNRERENLMGERTRIVNRMKSMPSSLRRAQLQANAAQGAETFGSASHAGRWPAATEQLRRAAPRHDAPTVRHGPDQGDRRDPLTKLENAPNEGPHAMVRLLARVIGVGIETADMLVHEILSRNLRDQRAVARYAGLTGSPDESGKRRRERGLARAGNARVRRGMIQLAWRFLMFQKESALTQWYRSVTNEARGAIRKTMIVALARKLLIALWRMVRTGEIPQGVALRTA